jgi:antitoxin component HigA of HigAB toxin-antitoxin module
MERTALMATTKVKAPKLADDYLELIKRFPLVRIKDSHHLEQAHKIIDELSIHGESDLTDGQLEYLLALGDLTSVYEREALEEMTENVTGLDLLRMLVEEHGLTTSDVGRIIGQRELGSKVLKGNRQISKSMAKALGARFSLAAELFLR